MNRRINKTSSTKQSRPLNRKLIYGALRDQSKALLKHEESIAAHTAVQTWTAILSLAMSLITTIALIFIAYSQFRVSERQVALEYAKTAPQFFAQVEYSSGEGRWGPSGVAVPVKLNFSLINGEINIKSISIIQEVYVRNNNDFGEVNSDSDCKITFGDWFSISPDQTSVTADEKVSALFPSLSFISPTGETMYLDGGMTRVIVKYEDLFGADRYQIIELSKYGELSVVKEPEWSQTYERGSGYLLKENETQPFSLFAVPKECKGLVI